MLIFYNVYVIYVIYIKLIEKFAYLTLLNFIIHFPFYLMVIIEIYINPVVFTNYNFNE